MRNVIILETVLEQRIFVHTLRQWISSLIFIILDQQIFRIGFIEISGTVNCLVLITFGQV